MPKVSEKPWSDFSASDYSPEQWHAACLIHQHDGAPTSKSQCKLPVREPDGTLNKAGVKAAAGALAGARGGVAASSEEKVAAGKAVARLYAQIGEEVPDSLRHSMVEDFLFHAVAVDIGGKSSSSSGSDTGKKGGKGDFDESKVKRDKGGKFAKKESRNWAKILDADWLTPEALQGLKQALISKEFETFEKEWNATAKRYGLTPDEAEKDPKIIAEFGAFSSAFLNRKAMTGGVSPSGENRASFSYNPSTQEIDVKAVPHKGPNPHPEETRRLQRTYNMTQRTIRSLPSRDDDDYEGMFNPDAKLDTSRVSDADDSYLSPSVSSLSQPLWKRLGAKHDDINESEVEDFLSHFGVKGMRWGIRKDDGGGSFEKALQNDPRPGDINSPVNPTDVKTRSGHTSDGVDFQGYRTTSGHIYTKFGDGTKSYWTKPDGTGKFVRRKAPSVHVRRGNKFTRAVGTAEAGASLAFLGRQAFDLAMSDESGEEASMTAVDETLAHDGLEPQMTVNDIFDEMSEEQRDACLVLFGAIVTDDDAVGGDTVVSGFKPISAIFNEMSLEQKVAVTFAAGGIKPEIQHADIVDEFLSHYGIKGMRWGYRKSEAASSARARVKSGTGTLEDAHRAALKSTGHRVLNGFLGDKQYWKEIGLSAAGIGVGAGLTLATAGLLPTDILADIGLQAMASSGEGALRVGDYAIASKDAAIAAGERTVLWAGAMATGTVAGAYNTKSGVTNLVRAVRGNARINKSYEAIGSKLINHQASGSRKLQRVLNRNGGIARKHLRQSEKMDEVEDFLSHYGIKGMRWGIRRPDGSDGTVSGRLSSGKKVDIEDNDDGTVTVSGRSARKAKPGEAAVIVDPETGKSKTVIKREDGKWAETRMAVDAESFVRTLSKEGTHEMSTREIKEAVNRAKQVAEYNKYFGPGPNKDLEDRVERMNLEMKYSEAKQAAHPGTLKRLAAKAAVAYGLYQTVDHFTGGELSKKVNGNFSTLFKTAGAAKAKPGSGMGVNPSKVKVTPGSPFHKPPPKRPTPVFNITSKGP